MSKGNLIIITAPSGTGKTSLVRELVKTIPQLMVSISYTTRPPRPGDEEGKDYHFVNKERFQQLLKSRDLLEYAEIYGYFYGTSRQWVQSQLDAGIDIILEIDWQGARQIQSLMPDAVSIFILPPSRQELERRIRDRGQDQPEVIAARLSAVHQEVKHSNEFKYLVVNDDFSKALAELQHIIHAQRLQSRIQREILADLLSDLLTDS